MKYRTKLSKMKKFDEGLMHTIHDEKLSDLMNELSFSSGIFFLLSGRKPSGVEAKLFDSMLLSLIDHGMGTPSSMATRFVASGRKSLATSVAAGILAVGNVHGGAMEKAMQQYQKWSKNYGYSGNFDETKKVICEAILSKEVIYGFGHKVYKEGDPRVRVLVDLMAKLGYESKHLQIKDLVTECFSEVKGKTIHMNVDGIIAVLLLDFGFDYKLASGIFVIARSSGLVAQAHEEIMYEKPFRRVSEEEIEYNEA